MLPSKIRLNDDIINSLRLTRAAKRIPACELSKTINRDPSYISSLELGRLRSISAADLVSIIGLLYNIPEHEAAVKAEELINEKKTSGNYPEFSPYNSTMGYYGREPMAVAERTPRYAEPELISDMLDAIREHLVECYKDNPKEAVYALQSLTKTLQLDSDFAMDIMEIPFYTLKSLSPDERKAVLDNLTETVMRHTGKVQESV